MILPNLTTIYTKKNLLRGLAVVIGIAAAAGFVSLANGSVRAEGDFYDDNLVNNWGLTNVSPNPKSMRLYDGSGSYSASIFNPPGTNNKSSGTGFKHILKNSQTTKTKQIELYAYFTSKNPGNKQVNIRAPSYGNNWCKFSATGSARKLRVVTSDYGNGFAIEKFNKQANPANTTNTCNLFDGLSFSFTKDQINKDPISGLYVAKVAFFLEGADVNTNIINQVSFSVKAPGAKKLGMKAETDATAFGIQENPDYENKPFGIKTGIPFGVPCDDINGIVPNSTVKVFDTDRDSFGNTYFFVMKRNANGSGSAVRLTKSEYASFTESNNKVRWISNNGGGSPASDNGYFLSTSLSTDSVSNRVSKVDILQMVANKNYLLVMVNPNQVGDTISGVGRINSTPVGNVLSFSVPTDTVTGDIDCSGYKLMPTVDPPGPTTSQVTAGAIVPVQGHVSPSGNDRENHEWELTKRIYDTKPGTNGATNTTPPCFWKPGKSCTVLRNNTKKFNTNDFDTPTSNVDTTGIEGGDWVCFVMSVKKPKDTSGATEWRHSPLKCVQVRSNTTGVVVSPGTYSYYPVLDGIATVNEKASGLPKKDNFKGKDHARNTYEWTIYESKFKNLPTGAVGGGNPVSGNNGCAKITSSYSGKFLNNSCRVVGSGDNLFPAGGADEGIAQKSFNSQQEGPDPIGTWTCYTIRYLTNPIPNQSLKDDINLWRNDWNDTNGDSVKPARWNDGRERYYVPTQYDSDGNVTVPGHYEWTAGKVYFTPTYNPYLNEYSTSPKTYKYTKFNQNSCSLSGISPKVQVRGHDVKTSGPISTYVQRILASSRQGNYGSFGEYGVLAGGAVATPDSQLSMASGVGLLYGTGLGSNQTNWSSLTFTNNTVGAFGNFDAVVPSNDPLKNGITPLVGPQNSSAIISANDLKKNAPRKTVTVQGTLTINSNIIYDDSYTKISQIPRVIIFADNIEIAPSVTRIDAWLVTTGTLNTCKGIAPGDPISIGNCWRLLQFNGAVYAENIELNRTGGSRTTDSFAWASPDKIGATPIDPNSYCEQSNCSDVKAALNAPAEVFNLRPDTYLSGFGGTEFKDPVAITDKVVELPPRF